MGSLKKKYTLLFLFFINLNGIYLILLKDKFFYCKQLNESINPENVCENREEFGLKTKAIIDECISDLNIIINLEDNDFFIKVFVYGN